MTGSGRPRVLVLDDREEVRELLCELLRQLGFEAEAVAAGDEAVKAVRRGLDSGRPFRCAVLDLTVAGGMSGCEVAARLRELDPGLRTVAMSGYVTDPVLADPTRHGFDAALAKPFTLAQLAEAVGPGSGS